MNPIIIMYLMTRGKGKVTADFDDSITSLGVLATLILIGVIGAAGFMAIVYLSGMVSG